MRQANQQNQDMTTISKTILTAKLIDGFWERWFVHGLKKNDLQMIRPTLSSKEQWINGFEELAIQKFLSAERLLRRHLTKEAEIKFRVASLYYQLIQWLIPENNEEKRLWLNMSLSIIQRADQITDIETNYDVLELEDHQCFGRVRKVPNAKGVVIIINPLDSTKEELFTYEMDFVNDGFSTVSFDGPGQGQTYTCDGFKATQQRWQTFINKIIDYAHALFTSTPVYLFGTSSGASWAIYGSQHPIVAKVVAVSPAFVTETIRLPDYFKERTNYVLEKGANHMLPSFEGYHYRSPVLLVHGNKDVMVSDEHIYNLYDKLPSGKWLKEYEDEGHCCNDKLPEIRSMAKQWFTEGDQER